MKTILALDLGTTTGWAYRDRDGRVTAGSWLLQDDAATAKARKTRMDRRLDARIPSLLRRLNHVWHSNQRIGAFEHPVDFLVWEDVQFSRYTMQTQLWASFRTVAWIFASSHTVLTDCCPVSTLKKFATGSGAADKDFMMRTAAEQFPGVPIVDDNCADALHLLQWAIKLTARAPRSKV